MNPARIRLNAATMHALRLRPPAAVMIEEHIKEMESMGMAFDRECAQLNNVHGLHFDRDAVLDAEYPEPAR